MIAHPSEHRSDAAEDAVQQLLLSAIFEHMAKGNEAGLEAARRGIMAPGFNVTTQSERSGDNILHHALRQQWDDARGAINKIVTTVQMKGEPQEPEDDKSAEVKQLSNGKTGVRKAIPMKDRDFSTMQVFTTGDAAYVCRVSQQTIIRCFDSGRLHGSRVPGSKFRRIPRESLERFMIAEDIPMDRFLGTLDQKDLDTLLGQKNHEDQTPLQMPRAHYLQAHAEIG